MVKGGRFRFVYEALFYPVFNKSRTRLRWQRVWGWRNEQKKNWGGRGRRQIPGLHFKKCFDRTCLTWGWYFLVQCKEVGVQRRVRAEMAKTFLLVSLIENSLSTLLIFSRQGQIPLAHTFGMPYLFTYSLDWNSYEVIFGVLILLSLSHHWTKNEDRGVNKCFKLMSKWMKDWVYEHVVSSVPGREDTERKKTEGGLPYKWTNNSKTNEHFKGQIQWVMGTDRNLAWFGMQGSDTSKNECMESRSVKRWDLRKEHSWQQELHVPTPEMKKNSAH